MCQSWREIGVRKWRVELQREHCARGHTSAAAAERVSSVTNAQLARAADLPGVLVQHSDRSGDGPGSRESVDQNRVFVHYEDLTARNHGNNHKIRENREKAPDAWRHTFAGGDGRGQGHGQQT